MPGIMQSNLLVPALQAGVVSCNSSLCMTVSHDDAVSFLTTQECGGSGLVAHTPHQVVNGVLHTAPTGGVADC